MMTLGATRPGFTLVTTPMRETFYWLPCMLRRDSEPHAWFIASNLRLRLVCFGCRPAEDRPLTEDQQERFEERAAILEYMAGFTRADAERLARAEVTRA